MQQADLGGLVVIKLTFDVRFGTIRTVDDREIEVAAFQAHDQGKVSHFIGARPFDLGSIIPLSKHFETREELEQAAKDGFEWEKIDGSLFKSDSVIRSLLQSGHALLV